VYYFCLRDGFCGRYSANPERLTDYLDKLSHHIRLQPVAENPQTTSLPQKRVYFRIPNYVYYTSVSALLILFYFFLVNLASTWRPL